MLFCWYLRFCLTDNVIVCSSVLHSCFCVRRWTLQWVCSPYRQLIKVKVQPRSWPQINSCSCPKKKATKNETLWRMSGEFCLLWGYAKFSRFESWGCYQTLVAQTIWNMYTPLFLDCVCVCVSRLRGDTHVPLCSLTVCVCAQATWWYTRTPLFLDCVCVCPGYVVTCTVLLRARTRPGNNGHNKKHFCYWRLATLTHSIQSSTIGHR